jgi:hypothetical protein
MQQGVHTLFCTFLHQRNEQYAEFPAHQRAEAVVAGPKRGRLFLALAFAHFGGQFFNRGRSHRAPHTGRYGSHLRSPWPAFGLHNRHKVAGASVRRVDHELKGVTFVVDPPEIVNLTFAHCVICPISIFVLESTCH